MATINVHVPDELLAELQSKAAAEGTTVDQLAEQAVRKLLAQGTLDRLKRAGDQRRSQMTDVDVEHAVERAVSDARRR
jgi:hypothetical protein